MNADSRPRLRGKTRPAAAFAALGESGLRRVDHSLATLFERDEVEDVHALRVAVRHLRAVLWIFGPLLPQGIAQRWNHDLCALADTAARCATGTCSWPRPCSPRSNASPGIRFCMP